MGYDLVRFCGEVDQELLCPICAAVLDDPVQISECEHAFCRECIQHWLTHQPICPVDRQTISQAALRMVPRITRNLLSRLSISCDNKPYGCDQIVKLDGLVGHAKECAYNPKRPIECELGCGLSVSMDQLKEHNCCAALRAIIDEQKKELSNLSGQVHQNTFQIGELKRKVDMYTRTGVRVPQISAPETRLRSDDTERQELLDWSNRLTPARVTRWGGMISTPDEYLQSTIKTALIASGCPEPVAVELMEHCHERKWPRGLSSLETRQNNRRQYESYVCKKIPGKQAVVVLQVDNIDVDGDMMVYPGLVMIFAHGIE